MHHPVGLGKESVAANVHAVAVVLDSPGEAADLIPGFKKDGLDAGMANQLKGRGQFPRGLLR